MLSARIASALRAHAQTARAHTLAVNGKAAAAVSATAAARQHAFSSMAHSSSSSVSVISVTAPVRPAISSSSLTSARVSLRTSAHRGFARKFGDANDAKEGKEGAKTEGDKAKAEGAADAAKEGEGEGEGNAVLGVVIILGAIGGGLYFLLRPKRPESEGPEPTTGEWLRGLVYGDSKLLPPEVPDPATGRRPRTLVVNFDKTIVHCDWTRAGGWQIRKRPGVDRFLERAHRAGYEIVLWANMPQYEVEALIAELDPSGFIKHKLYTEHTNFKKIGDAAPALVKDLVRLQRDPKRLIVVDVDTRKYAPIDDKQNVMTIQPFVDDVHDHELKNLTALLENIQRYNIHDVSNVIARYNADPKADLFAKERAAAAAAIRNLKGGAAAAGGVRARARAAKDEDDDEEEETDAKKKSGGGFMGYLRSWLPKGKSAAPAAPAAAAPTAPAAAAAPAAPTSAAATAAPAK